MKLVNVYTVCRKELTDALRDRRTLITTLLLPTLLFPLLLLGIGGLGYFLVQRAEQRTSAVMLLGEEHAPQLTERIRAQERFEILPPAHDYAERINDKKLQAVVVFPPGLERNLKTRPEETQVVKVYHYEGELRSGSAVGDIRKIVAAYRNQVVEDRLARQGLSLAVLTPYELERQNVASAEKVTGNLLGMLLPYFIILLCLTGAMYPAIDLTAGEKERGTMETILASPLRRTELVAGKFLMVFTASLLTTALSISSFALTILAGAGFIRKVTEGFAIAVSVKAVAAVFFLVVPLAVTFSAALMAIALFARSYREAQSYMAPLILVAILPAIASILPGVQLTPKLALIPILGVSLISKEILAGSYPWPFIGIIFGSTCLYAAIALYFAVRQFNREEVLFRT